MLRLLPLVLVLVSCCYCIAGGVPCVSPAVLLLCAVVQLCYCCGTVCLLWYCCVAFVVV